MDNTKNNWRSTGQATDTNAIRVADCKSIKNGKHKSETIYMERRTLYMMLVYLHSCAMIGYEDHDDA